MNVLVRSVALLLFVLFAISALPASATPPLTGKYKITGSADQGAQVRLTVELNILNPGDTAVTVTGVAIRSVSSPGQMVSATANAAIQSHSSAQISLQFLVPKSDFTAWSAGPHQQFFVTFQSTGGKSTLADVLLRRTQQ
ncbi:MAG: hypothetical protein WAM58_18775 [Candidatus Acidiferrum sp.]